MKQNLLLASIVLLMSSCSMKTYYQIVDVKSTNLQKESNNYVYNDGVCKITYNFWKEGGNSGFSIANLSDEVIYLDLGNTFYIENGIAYDYYRAKTGKNLKFVVANASSTGSNSDIAFTEKPVVAIPPHAAKTLYGYSIIGDVIQDCSVKMMVKKTQPEGKTFSESESPINFRNYITYRKGERGETKVVTNDFYISGFNNYLSSDILKTKRYGCKQTIIKTHYDKYAPDRFYIQYDETHSIHYSADANTLVNSSKDSKKDQHTSQKKGYSYW